MSGGLDRDAARALVGAPSVARLLAVLDQDGEETRIVGGAVRNTLIGLPAADIDLATTTLPEETMRRARAAGFKALPTGIKHGTVTVLIKRESFEVTTLREDIDTDGRHAVVRFGRDFAADARRRDFTINALSLDRAGEVHDHTGGLADLASRRIRFIGDAATRIREDYLRVLRFFRFQAQYGEGPIDRDGLAASIAARDELARISRERIRTELLKLVTARRGPEVAAIFEQAGLLGRLVPCLGDAGRLARSAGRPAIMRLGAYLVRTTADADHLKEALRLSKGEHGSLVAYARALTRLLSHEGEVDAAEAMRTAVLHSPRALASALAATNGERRPRVAPEAIELSGQLMSGDVLLPQFPLSGKEFLAAGAEPGPGLGRRLAAARAAWIAAGCPRDWRVGG